MFIINDYSTAIIFCVITMLCWGSWGNTQKFAEKSWRFELFYWDYVLGMLFSSLVLAVTLGNSGLSGRGFFEDIRQVKLNFVTSAMVGGVIFNAANILLGVAISIAGISVAFPVAIGIALVLGVLVNYYYIPEGNPVLIFGGVFLIVIAIILNAIAFKRKSKNSGINVKGLMISIVSGLLMGLFYSFVSNSIFPDFNHPINGMLSPYTALFFFAIGVFLSNLIFNTILMMKPLTGMPVKYNMYFTGSFKNHLMGFTGGLIWFIGMSFNIIASGTAGPVISYGLGQGATIVAALWGIYVWKEFEEASKNTKTLLNLMLIIYLAGIVLIVLAKN